MNRFSLTMAALAVVASTFSPPTLASSLRCGQHLIQAGGRSAPGMYEVLMKCGSPSQRLGATWIYKRQGSTTAVIFNDSGRLIRIETRVGG